MYREMHASIHLFCSAQGDKKDAQADSPRLKDREAHLAIREDVQEYEAASGR